MERYWLSTFAHSLFISSFCLHFFPPSPFPPSLSISYIKICHTLLQNVKYATFVANGTKILTYALWGNDFGSNLLRGSSASCAGLLVGERWHAFWQRGHFLFHLNCFHFHFLFPSSSCCLLSTYLLEISGMFFGGGAISSEPQETTPCQKRRWRGREGAAWGSMGKRQKKLLNICPDNIICRANVSQRDGCWTP